MKYLKLIVQYYLPIALVLTFTISLKKEVVTDGGFDRMYGFPLSYITNNYACTGCYDVYIFNLLFNILFYGVIYHLIFLSLTKFGIKRTTNKLGIWLGIIIIGLLTFAFYIVSFESNFLLFENTQYKVINKHLEFQFLNIGSR